MSTKISALPAASAIDVTDAAVGFPFVDATTTTVRLTIAQLRTQIDIGSHTMGQIYAFTGLKAASSTQSTFATADAQPMILTIGNNTNVSMDIQSVEQGVAFRPLRLNAGGGGVVIASAATTTTVQGALTLNGLTTIPSTVASAAGTGTDIVLGATTQTTVGAAGAASALPAQPLGYLVFYKGTTKCAIPYWNG
jgi:hypothetical protein